MTIYFSVVHWTSWFRILVSSCNICVRSLHYTRMCVEKGQIVPTDRCPGLTLKVITESCCSKFQNDA